MPLRRRLIWVLLFALVAAQTLGLMHRIVHAPGTGAAFAGSAPVAQGWVQDLFAGHEGDASCRLFDQLNASGVLPDIPAVPIVQVLPAYFLQWYLGQALARWAALFDARGPPLLR
jgi:hypothetical protein